MPIEIVTGDITAQDMDAIVNAANPSLLAGSGVCGAIHQAAGAELERECLSIGPIGTGNAVITPGFRLKARHVIHAVGPRWYGGENGEAALLEKCYRSIFGIVQAEGIKSVAIPAIGTGIYRYPLELATPIAVSAAREHDATAGSTLIRFVCFDARTCACYENCLQ